MFPQSSTVQFSKAKYPECSYYRPVFLLETVTWLVPQQVCGTSYVSCMKSWKCKFKMH